MVSIITMLAVSTIKAHDVRRVRRLLDETQVQFAKRLGVDPVTVARWETGQRRCTGAYAEAVLRLDPEARPPVVKASSSREEATVSALAQLVRTLFQGSTAKAVSALLARERLSANDLDALARLIEAKKKEKR
jgi:transcriptional regulator with XRE-family HTH domain